MIRAKCTKIKPKPPPLKKKGSNPPKKLSVDKLKNQTEKDKLVTAISANLPHCQQLLVQLKNSGKMKNVVYSASSDVLGTPTRKHADWFDESNEEIM